MTLTAQRAPRQEAERTAQSFMAQHFVALSCQYESLNKDGSVFHSGTMIFSGFVIDLLDTWYWVTAGHCVQEELDDNINQNKIRIVGGSFVDYLGIGAKHFSPYPYTYSPGDGLYLYRPEAGLDFAVIRLDGLMQAAFRENGVVPIGRENWVRQPELTFSFYRMLGIPCGRIMTTKEPDGSESVSIGTAFLAVDDVTEEEFDSIPDYRPNMFIGKIAPEAKIESIKGMSGGPIFGFRYLPDSRLVYHAVALQSSWYPDSRIICGCPLIVFAENLYQILIEKSEASATQEVQK